jgi:hypothetical protein
MSDIFVMCQPALRERGNNLAEELARVPGSGANTFDVCPRVVDGQGNVWLWANFQRYVSIVDEPDYFNQLNDDAKTLLSGALTITPEMLGEGGVLPDTSGRFVIAPNITAQSILAAYGLVSTESDE